MSLFIKKVLYFLPLLFIFLFINIFIDPFGVFHTLEDDDRWIVEQLAQGKNVIYGITPDERLIQKGYIEKMSKMRNNFDIVVIGSSRSMQINSDMFQGKKFFNSSVTGASLQDMIAITEVYKEFEVDINTLVIGVDPWIFNDQNGLERGRLLEPYYYHFLESENLFDLNLFEKIIKQFDSTSFDKQEIKKKFQALFSLKYFQHALFVKEFTYESQVHHVAESIYQEKPVKVYDGSVTNSRDLREKSNDAILAEVNNYIVRGSAYSLDSFQKIDGNLEMQFKVWVEDLTDSGVVVILFLPPYHPVMYDFLINSPTYRIVQDVEHRIREISEMLNIMVVGSYNPEYISFLEPDFYDFMHPRREAVERLFLGDSVRRLIGYQ